jgi:ribose/xylose/arabinose/galactoside ABC-type transport system permease subunit
MEAITNSRSIPERLIRSFAQYPQLGAAAILVAVFIIFTVMSPVIDNQNVFISGTNIVSIIEQSAGISIAAFGMTLVLLVAGIDISTGSTMALVSVISARLLVYMELPLLPTILIALAVGAAIGLANGWIIVKFKVQPFLVTMGMQTIVIGVAYSISRGESTFLPDRTISAVLVRGTVLGIPASVFWIVGILIIMYLLASRSPIGRRMQAIGGNETAALNSGINVNSVKIFAYTICGILAAFAGLISLARLGTGMTSIGAGYEMNAIAAAIIGGTSFNGDGGNMVGTLMGALVMGVISNGLTILSVDSYVQDIIRGGIIVFAVVVSNMLVQRRAN